MKRFLVLVTILSIGFAGSASAENNGESKNRNEPTNPAEAATKAAEASAKKSAEDAEIVRKYEALVAAMPSEEAAWEKTLQDNMGSFYFYHHRKDKVQGISNGWEYVKDDPKLPRVLLIGDSVSRGYTIPTRKYLEGKANIHRAPENCGSSDNGLKKLQVWLGTTKWDVIHFNFGIHDRSKPVSDYQANLKKIATLLQQTGATVIWASTTPVPLNEADKQYPEAIIERNAAAAEVMSAMQIPIDDLYAYIQPRLAEAQIPNNVHFTKKGYDMLGQCVGAVIAANLPPKAAE